MFFDFQQIIVQQTQSSSGTIKIFYESPPDNTDIVHHYRNLRANYHHDGKHIILTNIRIQEDDLLGLSYRDPIYDVSIYSTNELIHYDKDQHTINVNPQVKGWGESSDPPPRSLLNLFQDFFYNCPSILSVDVC